MINRSKQAILSRLRGSDQYGERFLSQEVSSQESPFIPVNGDFAEAFKKALETISGICYIVDSEHDAFLTIESYCKLHSIRKVHASSGLQEKLSIIDVEVVDGDAHVDEHPFAVSNCECLSARTGSVLVSSNTSLGRKTHSFAEVHAVIAYEEQIVADIPEAIEMLLEKYDRSLPSAVTLITGQSRTADIEKTLILGAHGPKELIVFIIRKGE